MAGIYSTGIMKGYFDKCALNVDLFIRKAHRRATDENQCLGLMPLLWHRSIVKRELARSLVLTRRGVIMLDVKLIGVSIHACSLLERPAEK